MTFAIGASGHTAEHNRLSVGSLGRSVLLDGATGDGVTDDSTAIQLTIDTVEAAGGGVVYFPAGTYLCNTELIVDDDDVWLVGESRGNTIINFDTNDTAVDGIKWTETSGSGYISSGGMRDLTVKAATDRADVRDVVYLDSPARFTIERCVFRGGYRYGLSLDFAIDTSIVDCEMTQNNDAGLYINALASTSTTLRVRGCYFHYTKSGPGADVKSLGAHFEGCVFESNGETTPALGHGVLVRGGYVTLHGCYWENNAAWDVQAGTESSTHLTIVGFFSLVGPYTDGVSGHVDLGAYIDAAFIAGGKMDTRPISIQIDPGAAQVHGMGIDWSSNAPEMSDASDIMATDTFLYGQDPVSGQHWGHGRYDPKVRWMSWKDSSGVYDRSGTGSPENVITAAVGSTYRRDDGGAGTSFYVKESGVGNTGWVAK